ncbi:hypothetical protein cpbgf_2001340 [Cryptosporidium parvum]|uniref:Uncharacterized protein n=1 Tax=Cryptosporidium parvum TaxID=5807 RepID=A0A7S7LJV4_CRYPV|nr:hypothetical protein ChTU502y2012_420g0025 [Cryptosporidium hominis]QOY43101.1 hypothetical protein CPATCC_0029520 [Cryptosporidium parvum]WRK30920.1 hypothetical protein cpbgf_2001340 [Cryptosporidium parvum]|eukprot:QOY43101.1 hypothetical protein CPATCC_000813 [Cryptosporidium parvum]
MKKRSIPWKTYLNFCIQVCNQLKKLEIEWKQPQSDISLISWFMANKTKKIRSLLKNGDELTIEEYNLMISKAVEDGMLHVVDSYLDPIDGSNVRLLSIDKFFFPEIWF